MFFNESSHLLGEPPITAHATEVLHQVEGAKVPVGGWVGRDSWFGSVLSAVETMKCFQVYSTWVIKQNSDFFPMQAIHSALKARFGDRLAGHCVVFQMELSGVKLLAIGYAWSQSSISYFLSTCRSTNPSANSYVTCFEDAFGTICTWSIP